MEIEARDLRIGNQTDKGRIKSFYEGGIHVVMGKTFRFNELKPILLTEEWLIKFGFVKYGKLHDSYRLNPFIVELGILGDHYTFRKIINKNESILLKEIKHVHQLQNLYFVLTGKELTHEN